MGRYIIGFIFIVFGISAFTGYDLGKFIWPVILILIGLAILTGRHGQRFTTDKRDIEQDTFNEVVVFSSAERKIVSSEFTSGKIVAVFGGADFDISEVKTKKKVVEIELVSVFGGLSLKIPDNWYVTSEAVGVMGGIDNRAQAQKKDVELHIKGSAVFGGIEIFN